MNDAEKHMILPDQVPAAGAVKSELEHILKQLRRFPFAAVISEIS